MAQLQLPPPYAERIEATPAPRTHRKNTLTIGYNFPVSLRLHRRRPEWYKWTFRKRTAIHLSPTMSFDELRRELNQQIKELYETPTQQIIASSIWIRTRWKRVGSDGHIYTEFSGMWVSETTCEAFVMRMKRLFEQGDRPGMDVWVRCPAKSKSEDAKQLETSGDEKRAESGRSTVGRLSRMFGRCSLSKLVRR